ncbi:MAG TPA: hypothetical protein VJT49_23230 [Amycolatopsis sp.]|uniref:hypothetical protein n=1 Tax=Amycolatopsis sp. TaxID=37632 RepID=UPI002B4633C4|nr:hypothetical protein [Amycolatopsis sp.]HKS47970.1 hypothetical protein [Amycolatopsis sp.]
MGVLVILIIIGLVAWAIFRVQVDSRLRQQDAAAGIVARFGDLRLTKNELFEGPESIALRHSLEGLEIDFAMSGSINRAAGRVTLTRMAVLGPGAWAVKKGRNKKTDDREGFLTIVGPGVAITRQVPGRSFATAAEFVAAFKAQVAQVTTAETVQPPSGEVHGREEKQPGIENPSLPSAQPIPTARPAVRRATQRQPGIRRPSTPHDSAPPNHS